MCCSLRTKELLINIRHSWMIPHILVYRTYVERSWWRRLSVLWEEISKDGGSSVQTKLHSVATWYLRNVYGARSSNQKGTYAVKQRSLPFHINVRGYVTLFGFYCRGGVYCFKSKHAILILCKSEPKSLEIFFTSLHVTSILHSESISLSLLTYRRPVIQAIDCLRFPILLHSDADTDRQPPASYLASSFLASMPQVVAPYVSVPTAVFWLFCRWIQTFRRKVVKPPSVTIKHLPNYRVPCARRTI